VAEEARTQAEADRDALLLKLEDVERKMAQVDAKLAAQVEEGDAAVAKVHWSSSPENFNLLVCEYIFEGVICICVYSFTCGMDVRECIAVFIDCGIYDASVCMCARVCWAEGGLSLACQGGSPYVSLLRVSLPRRTQVAELQASLEAAQVSAKAAEASKQSDDEHFERMVAAEVAAHMQNADKRVAEAQVCLCLCLVRVCVHV
jgi:hypothetical protein